MILQISESPLRDVHLQHDDAFFDSKRSFFDKGNTLSYAFRKSMLEKLKRAIKSKEDAITKALHDDLKKSHTESYLTEVGIVITEIDYALKHLKEWMKTERKSTPLALQVSRSEIRYEPKGVVLIIAPWNYPINLVFAPLVGAIAAGNCAVIKPSEEAPATAQLVEEIISDIYQNEYISVVQGIGSEVVPHLLKSYVFNHIFFTGSPGVGKIIAKQAAENLVSTTLELGGKSPAIVDSTANLKIAAKRIVWGKFINAGQTCVAPDYLLVEEKIKSQFLDLLKKTIADFYGPNPQESPDYPRMIHDRRFDAISEYLKEGQIAYGGKTDRKDLYIEPTLMTDVSMDAKVMHEEIFGPVLPILSFSGTDEIIEIIRKNRYPLACYYFGTDRKRQDLVLDNISFGGGCVNNTLVHLGNPDLPFGGVQSSGSGNYHGRNSFLCFSHAKSMMISKNWFDPFIKYPPFNKLKLKIFRKLL